MQWNFFALSSPRAPFPASYLSHWATLCVDPSTRNRQIMDGLVDYESSSNGSSNADDGKLEKERSPHTPFDESEVSSSVVQEVSRERANSSTENPVTTLRDLGCSSEKILHAISVCGYETRVEDLFDFIQACECSIEEARNTVEMPIHEENARMQEPMEPRSSLRMHIMDSYGSEGKDKSVMQTQGYTGEASCSRIPDVGDYIMSTLEKLVAIGFSQDQVQRASNECNSIDFDILLNFLLDNKEVEPHIDDFSLPEVDSSENEDCEAATVRKLQNLEFPLTGIKKALAICGSHDFEEVLDVLNAFETLKDERDVAAAKESTQTYQGENADTNLFNDRIPSSADGNLSYKSGVQGENDWISYKSGVQGENAGANLFNDWISYSVDGNLSYKSGVQGENAGANFFNDRVPYSADGNLSYKSGVQVKSAGVSLFSSRISYASEGHLRYKAGSTKWTGNMEKLWCSYMGTKKKMDFSPLSGSDDSEAEIFQPTWEDKNPKKKGSKRKLEFEEYKEVDQKKMGKMMGFGIPGYFIGRPKTLPYLMHGPPYFYFENVAGVPNNEWDTIKRHFNGVDPEFTDSKFFSASRRPRGYVHNLPIEGRVPLSCAPPMTISEAFPETQQYWPRWDTREKLNCINTRKAPDSLCRLIRILFALFDDDKLPYHRQQEIVQVCKKWNLVWVGPGQAAPLEPHEIELLLGFDRDHTRGCSSMTERYDALGNSFQVNTVAYHLSPLKSLCPNGVTVLSLFAGIGGAEVALHKLGVHLKVVIAVEINEKVRGVLASWWRRSGQRGELKLRSDVRDLTHDVLANLLDEVGPIDLIIGGSPCNNLSGNNRVSRVGLNGTESSLFFEFPRILNIVTQVMRDKGFL